MFLTNWVYNGRDPGLRLFTLANPLLPPVPEGGHVFEVGCCDTDFLPRVRVANPSLTVTGIDQRPYNLDDATGVLLGDVLTVDLPPASLDVVCSLSAIEHIGLGHYKDPKDPDGDITALRRIRTWLKPGGWCYFDVPYRGEGYTVQGTEYRAYDDRMLQKRLGPLEVLGYAHTDVLGWTEKPVKAPRVWRKYDYVACLVRM